MLHFIVLQYLRDRRQLLTVTSWGICFIDLFLLHWTDHLWNYLWSQLSHLIKKDTRWISLKEFENLWFRDEDIHFKLFHRTVFPTVTYQCDGYHISHKVCTTNTFWTYLHYLFISGCIAFVIIWFDCVIDVSLIIVALYVCIIYTHIFSCISC